MSIKLILENWRRFVTEEEQPQTNYQKVLDYLKSQGFEVTEIPPSALKIKTDEDRSEVKSRIESDLQKLGLKFNELTHGSGFGRFELQAGKNEGGSVYVYIKPKKGGAAQSGQKYEDDIAALLTPLLPSDFVVKTAGFAAGTDLVIKGPHNKLLHMELKTSSGADFGQFKLKYYPRSHSWDTMKTAKFLENEDLFQGLFDDTMKAVLDKKKFTINNDDPFHYSENDGAILGLTRSTMTPQTKERLQKELFGGKDSLYFNVDPQKIQNYYAKKGDSLLSIQDRGVFALTPEAASVFGIPELKDNISPDSAKIRFRIKPYMGGTGYHTFSCALKIKIQRSNATLKDSAFIQKIVDYLA